MSEPARRLYRSRDRVVAGVCGGLGAYFNLDPVLIRVIWACLTLFSAVIGGILVYIIFWIATPEEGDAASGPGS